MKEWRKMTKEEKEDAVVRMYYALSLTKRLIRSDMKGGGLSEYIRAKIEEEVEIALM